MDNINEKTLDFLNQGSMMMSRENYNEAIKYFKQAVTESPKWTDCYINLGNAYASTEQYDEAVETFKRGLILEPKNVELLFGMGNLYYLQGTITDAVKYYNKAEETGEMNSEMFEVLAGIFEDTNDYIQALRYINKAIALEPLNGEYYLQKTRIFIEQEKADEAIEVLKELNAILPDAYEAYDMLSEIYIIKEDYDKALELVNKAFNKFPSDPNIAYLKLKVFVKFQKDDEANSFVRYMKEKELFNERCIDNSLLEADVLVRSKKLEEAALCLEDAVNGKYEDDRVSFVLVNIYMTLEDFDKVRIVTSDMLNYEGDMFFESTARFYHAESSLRLGNDEAKEEFKEIVKLFRKFTIIDPSFYQGYVYRALAHKELQEYSDAIELTNYIESLFPERPDAYAIRYSIYKDMGDTKNADLMKSKIKEVDPSFVI